jgi:hypothetical protein
MKNKGKIIAGFLNCALMLSSFAFTSVTTFAAETTGQIIYVSPTGNDANDGSEGSPLATLSGARDKIRSIKSSSGYPSNGITVVFRGGQYKWTDTVEFNEASVYQSKFSYSWDYIKGTLYTASPSEKIAYRRIKKALEKYIYEKHGRYCNAISFLSQIKL